MLHIVGKIAQSSSNSCQRKRNFLESGEMITQQLVTYLEQCFTMPVLPASVLMIMLLAYTALVILGALDFDVLDFDLDMDLDADLDIHSFSSVGFVTLRFLNIAQIPMMVWLCVFGFCWWLISIGLWESWDQGSADPNTTLLLLRNIGAAVVVTKVMTNPMKSFFETPLETVPEDLIGSKCEITTYEATTEFGQAKYESGAAPLLLDVKMQEGVLSKGSSGLIVDYCPETKIYFVVAESDPP